MIRFELEGCSGSSSGSDSGRGVPAPKLTITTPSGVAASSSLIASPLTLGCLQVGGGVPKSPLGGPNQGDGDGVELFLAPTTSGVSTPSTPTSATTVGAMGGLLRHTTANRMLVRPCQSNVVVANNTPAVAATVGEVRREMMTPPPPYRTSVQQVQQQQAPPLSTLPPHLRHHQHQHKRQSHYSVSAPSSPTTTHVAPPMRSTSPAPASDLDSILHNIDDDRRQGRESVLLAGWEARRASRGSRAYAKYCENN
ncbi:hypothetical protein PG994_002578 [Apiospora phragmitis]|uniref:Uncharacterized protein n=1 Tax=Apiospora phragmitis TaxID=2905665 RepID=A0ABR1W8A4_9PEZI